jgi:hypothetical protein
VAKSAKKPGWKFFYTGSTVEALNILLTPHSQAGEKNALR